MRHEQFQLGLAIWGYRGWLGDLFPTGTASTDFLRLYGQRFRCVEGNTTFYAIPSMEIVQRWAAQVPIGFQFCPKFPKIITHSGALLPQLAAGLQFLERMRGLGDHLGPLFIQLPPRYGPRQLADLNQFLQAWTAAVPECELALEVRHRDWFQPEMATTLNAILEDLGVGRVLLDSRPIYTGAPSPLLEQLPIEQREKKPRLPLQPQITSDFAFVRYISHPDLSRNESFLAEWMLHIKQWIDQGRRIYFFVHCPIEAHSPTIARHFQTQLEAAAVPVPSLPWMHLPPVATSLDSTQLNLFS